MRFIAALVVATLVALSRPAVAEMSADDYQTGARRLTPAQQAQEAERIRREREHTEAVEREREAQAEQARRDEQARLAARPLGVRLVETRCGACHGADYLRDHRYGWLGWWSVLLRMEYVNGARFEAGERRVIVAHLASSLPATSTRAGFEWTAAAALPALLLAVAWVLRRRVH
jgi:hypothetical protein